ncbi:MAG: hypothetical protein KF891_08695 [Rhizobacter sp.]|nr:hypothetical protein [Rhizobacter sp.]
MNRSALLAIALAFASTAALAEAPAKPAAKKHVAVKKAAAETPLPAADQAQLDAADRAFLGTYECDYKQTIDVEKNAKNPGYLDVKFKNKSWTMKPSLSSTGALRMEDTKGGALLLQIANKSMLMDTKIGQRLVDACVHEKQRAAAAAAAK